MFSKQKDIYSDVFDLQNIKSGTVFLYSNIFYCLIFAADIVSKKIEKKNNVPEITDLLRFWPVKFLAGKT